jgi:hypothetical protein
LGYWPGDADFDDDLSRFGFHLFGWGTGRPVMVILVSPLGRSHPDARAKSEASLRRHTFVRYPTRVWKFERLSLNAARFPTR